MTPDTIAAQLYTIRAHLQEESQVAASLKRIADIGFKAVQISGMKAPLAESAVKTICEDLGLTICATHEPGVKIIDETEAVIERLQALGCPYTAYPHPHVPLESVDDVQALAAGLEQAAQKMHAAGIGLGYHNHAVEFRRFGDRTALDIIFDEAPTLIGEIDTFWVQRGGANPTSWCRRLVGRMPIVHLKDAAMLEDKSTCVFCEIGSGNLEWPSIIAALREGGCQWYIIEQDQCPGDPFQSLQQSRDWLVANCC